jgi:hypothetical protein
MVGEKRKKKWTDCKEKSKTIVRDVNNGVAVTAQKSARLLLRGVAC